jgi:hypothetical protein
MIDRCVGHDCGRLAEHKGLRPVSLLCFPCRQQMSENLRALPELYDACAHMLTVSGRHLERTSGGSLPGLPFNATAADARTQMITVLASWSGLVAERRSVAPPERTVVALTAFLLRHLNWLACDPGVADAAGELASLVQAGRRVAYFEPVRQVQLGRCMEPCCPGQLTAFLPPGGPPSGAEIRCSVKPEHRWRDTGWRTLSVLGEVSWLRAGDIARLWRVPSGSVYRMASEHRWRRRTKGGKTFYHRDDVDRSLSARMKRTLTD